MKEEKDILKWLNGELSKEELVAFKKTEAYANYKHIAHYSSQLATPTIDANQSLLQLKEKLKGRNKKGKVVSFPKKPLLKYAAAVAVLVVSALFFFSNSTTFYQTQFAESIAFNLPDKSEVQMNANSTIKYKKKSWNTSRSLSLDGEAFFKVQKGKTFSVLTNVGEVTVLGTQFNVKKRTNYFEVKCYEGLVRVTYNNRQIKLSKGKMFKAVNQKIDSVTTFNDTDTSWRQKESTFTSIPLKFVLDELKNQYGYTIQYNTIDTNQLFTGSFTHTDIDIALKAITIPLNLSYKIEDNTIILSSYDRKN